MDPHVAGGPGRLFTLWLLPRAREAFNSEREKGSVLSVSLSPSVTPQHQQPSICPIWTGPGECWGGNMRSITVASLEG